MWNFPKSIIWTKGISAYSGFKRNSDGTENTGLRIEYKWLESGTVSKATFVSEFIERDLFSIPSLELLQWRVKGQKLDKATVKLYMESVEGRKALKLIPASQANKLLDRTDLNDASDFEKEEIADAFISYLNTEINFDKIFPE